MAPRKELLLGVAPSPGQTDSSREKCHSHNTSLNAMVYQPNKQLLIFLLCSIGIITFPHVYHIPVTVFSYFYGLLAWRLLVIWKPQYLPGPIMIGLICCGAIVLMYFKHQTFLGRDAGTSLFILTLGLKSLEIKKERDLYLLCYLCFIVVGSQFLFQQNLLFALYGLVACSLLVTSLIYINHSQMANFVPGNSVAVKSGQMAITLLLQALPLAIALFILFPRIDPPRWLLFDKQGHSKTGLSDSMEPGSISDLSLSDDLVFRVTFAGAIPPPAQRYWRGPVLTHTDGKKWTQVSTSNPVTHLAVSGSAYQYTLLLEPQNKNWVFALDMPVKFSRPLFINVDYQMLTSGSFNKRSEYAISSYPSYHTGDISDNQRMAATQMPGEPSEKIKQLVNQLHGFDNKPEEYIAQLLKHFRTEDFHYTLTPPALVDNPIETFLFETRRGFCSHYASAFVYLLRVAQIPARVVTGYQGGELNHIGNFLEIKQSDAHAWAEVWLASRGWVRVDPTAAVAPERIEQGFSMEQQFALGVNSMYPYLPTLTQSWLKQAHQLWRSLDYKWQHWVVNYDNRQQIQFLSTFGIKNSRDLINTMIGVIGFISVVLCGYLLPKRSKKTDKILSIYQQFCKKLVKYQLIKLPQEGAKDFAERAKNRLPEHAAVIDQITELFIRLRYERESTDLDFKQLQCLIRQLTL